MAVRLSLGATRARIVRQLVAEGLLVALVACGVGLAGSAALTRAMGTFIPFPVAIDWRTRLLTVITDPNALGQVWVFVVVPLLASFAGLLVWLAISEATIDETILDETFVDTGD